MVSKLDRVLGQNKTGCDSYLRDHGHEDFVVGLGVVVEGVLMASELHGHLHALRLGRLVLVVVLSVLSWLTKSNIQSVRWMGNASSR